MGRMRVVSVKFLDSHLALFDKAVEATGFRSRSAALRTLASSLIAVVFYADPKIIDYVARLTAADLVFNSDDREAALLSSIAASLNTFLSRVRSLAKSLEASPLHREDVYTRIAGVA